jgi:hypothetical protein
MARSIIFACAIMIIIEPMAFSECGTLTFSVDVTGPGVWEDGGYYRLSYCTPTAIRIYCTSTEGDQGRHGWSSPFSFTSTAPINEVMWGDYHEFAQPQFLSFWELGTFAYIESWDGQLPDLYGFTGISSSGCPLEFGPMKIFEINFIIDGDHHDFGDFCIEQGDAVNDTYDWLFEDPVPTFPKTCWQLKMCPCLSEAYFVNCPSEFHLWVDQPFRYTFETESEWSGPSIFCLKSGIGEIDKYSGEWTYTADTSDAWQIMETVVQGADSYVPCGLGDTCTVAVIINGLCGDLNKDMTINILDIVYLINYIYQGGPAPDPVEAADVDSSGTINILDITRLIGYVYMGGPAPVCP